MLQTLAKIGEQLLEGKGIWARLTTEPTNYDNTQKNRDYWVCPILFDCVHQEIKVLKDEMEIFKPEESALKFKYVKATRKGPSQSKFDLTVERNDISNLKESLFGKEKSKPGCLTVIESSLSKATKSIFYEDLQRIYSDLSNESNKLNSKWIKQELEENYNDIVLFTSYIQTKRDTKPKALFEYEEFQELAEVVFKRENPREYTSRETSSQTRIETQ